QALPCCPSRHELSFSTLGRNHTSRQNRRDGGQGLEGTVGVPKLICFRNKEGSISGRHNFAVRADIVHAGIERTETRGSNLGLFKRAEATGERRLQIVCYRLATQ